MASTFLPSLVLSFLATLVNAETHTVMFDNQCGHGTPQLIQGNDVLTTTSYTFDAPYSGIAYLQNGTVTCGFNGENCGIIEMTLINPTVPGGGSSVDISYIPPLAYSVPYSFEYYGGCDGQGASCDGSSAVCPDAFYTPDQTEVQVACETDNVNLLITFCGSGTSSTSAAESSSSAPTTSVTQVETTSTAVTSSDELASSVVSSSDQSATSVVTSSDELATSVVSSSDELATTVVSSSDELATTVVSSSDELATSVVSSSDQLATSVVPSSDELASSVVTSTSSAASSTPSSRRCRNRNQKRRTDDLSQGLRAHRRRSSISHL